jgi:hypothetical protein
VKTTVSIIFTALLATSTHAPGFATETGTMMCKGGIVSTGDSAGEVISKCGQPASTSQREQKSVVEGTKVTGDRTITTITIDDWIFNFGPNQFQYQLTLHNGRVARIESLGYGY